MCQRDTEIREEREEKRETKGKMKKERKRRRGKREREIKGKREKGEKGEKGKRGKRETEWKQKREKEAVHLKKLKVNMNFLLIGQFENLTSQETVMFRSQAESTTDKEERVTAEKERKWEVGWEKMRKERERQRE
jgi:hypothetical protein